MAHGPMPIRHGGLGRRIGLLINLVGIVVTTALFYLLGTVVLGIDLGAFPDWAVGVGVPTA